MARALVHPRRSASLARLYPTPCTIEHVGSSVGDGRGGWTPGGPTSVAATCRWGAVSDVAGGEERVIAMRLAAEATVFVAFPAGTEVHPEDRVFVAGMTLAVKAVTGRGSFEGERVALCTETS